MSYLATHSARVVTLAAEHLALVVAAALAVAFAIALPLGIYAARGGAGSPPWLLGALGAIYTIPSLALLAVLVEWFGLGFTPIFVALVVYAQFMLARNVSAGIAGVDPAQVDAARGLGDVAAQVLARVEIPQALPVRDRRGAHRRDRDDRDRDAGRLRGRRRARRADLQRLNAASAGDDRGRQPRRPARWRSPSMQRFVWRSGARVTPRAERRDIPLLRGRALFRIVRKSYSLRRRSGIRACAPPSEAP